MQKRASSKATTQILPQLNIRLPSSTLCIRVPSTTGPQDSIPPPSPSLADFTACTSLPFVVSSVSVPCRFRPLADRPSFLAGVPHPRATPASKISRAPHHLEPPRRRPPQRKNLRFRLQSWSDTLNDAAHQSESQHPVNQYQVTLLLLPTTSYYTNSLTTPYQLHSHSLSS